MVRKAAPKPRIAAQIDRVTGVIHQTIRGTNFIVDANEWDEVTDDPRVLELFSADGAKKLLQKNGKLVTKPVLRVRKDVDEFEITDGKALITFEIDGDTRYVPDDLNLRINSKSLKVRHDETIEIKSTVTNRLTIRIDDDRVYIPESSVSVVAVPKGEVDKPKSPPKEDEGVTIGRQNGKKSTIR